jgi:cobalt-zinc-cadmium efflux system outer membrane protein
LGGRPLREGKLTMAERIDRLSNRFIACRSIPILGVTLMALLLTGNVAGQSLPPPPAQTSPPASPPNQAASRPAVRVTLDRAIELALQHNHSLLAARTTIDQSRAQEVTANMRPNPVLVADEQYLPVFSPSSFSGDYVDQNAVFDIGLSYLIERGQKRQRRLEAATDQTAVTVAGVSDNERTLTAAVAQQFIGVLLANANLDLATQDLDSYQQTVQISEARFQAGGMSEGDLLKIKLQLLQFQMDLSAARLAKVQALATLRQAMGFESVPDNYDVEGTLTQETIHSRLDDLKMMALRSRPDYRAAQLGVTSAQSQYKLAQANAKKDLGVTFTYNHLTGINAGSLFFNIEIPIFDRNQGEIARTRFAITQAQETNNAALEGVMTDVAAAYENLHTNDEVVNLYSSGYLKQSEDSRDIAQYAYQRGAASLLDYLDAERSYRTTQLAYRQALALQMLAVEQLRQAVGTRSLP